MTADQITACIWKRLNQCERKLTEEQRADVEIALTLAAEDLARPPWANSSAPLSALDQKVEKIVERWRAEAKLRQSNP